MSLRRFIDWLRERDGATEDWTPGDLAECVERAGWVIVATCQPCDGPRHGQLLRVAAVDSVDGLLGLAFEGWGSWWTAKSFRKITPRQTEACTPAFKRQLKDCRPKVDA